MNATVGVETGIVVKTDDTPFDPEAWVSAFSARHGRRPRVLHIGNIAANAYNNAKMMNTLGFECEVLCADYYHMMGCPEWEDADFEGDIGDHFAPTWFKVNLRGYERPRWFAQGPLELCLRYLGARAAGRQREADYLWRALGVFNRTRAPGPLESLQSTLYQSRQLARRIAAVLDSPVRRARVIARLEEIGTRWRHQWRRRHALAASMGAVRNLSRAIAGNALLLIAAVLRACFTYLPGGRNAREVSTAGENASAQLAAMLCDDFKRRFPSRTDTLVVTDVAAYASNMPSWQEVFASYDLVQGYATDPIFPMLTGHPYCAFEHGTLRELPFRNDALGRMTALAYARAQQVFVTNSDCIDNAHLLAGSRAIPLPHPFDEDRAVRVIGADALRTSLKAELNVDILAFFPTRHDWVVGTGFADKANDRFFQALARLHRDGFRVGVVCCEWGRNVVESKALIRDLGLENCVKWVAPMGVVRYERHVLACDFVVDQFLLGAFGGVTFRALAAGRPVLTWLRSDEVARSFGTCPPIINCQSTEDIVQALGRALSVAGELQRIGADARRWVERYHSGRATVTTQLRAYARIIEESRSSENLSPKRMLR